MIAMQARLTLACLSGAQRDWILDPQGAPPGLRRRQRRNGARPEKRSAHVLEGAAAASEDDVADQAAEQV